MKTFVFSVISFGIGVAGGYFLGHELAKKKYLKMADNEIESVKTSLKSYYEEKCVKSPEKGLKTGTLDAFKEPKIDRPKVDVPVKDVDSIDYEALKNNNNEQTAYNKYANLYKPQEKKEEPNKEEEPQMKPYVISPEEFSEGMFDTRTLNYYKDGILADEDYNIVKDIKGTVGDEALNSFGVYESDSVYVRNEEYSIDYEILFVDDTFANAAPKGVSLFPGQDDE